MLAPDPARKEDSAAPVRQEPLPQRQICQSKLRLLPQEWMADEGGALQVTVAAEESLWAIQGGQMTLKAAEVLF